jgi:predicted ABC-type ATPase
MPPKTDATKPRLWLVAGPNGAGKSTIVQAKPIQRVLTNVTFLNPDSVARTLLRSQGFDGFGDAPPHVQQVAFLDAANIVEAVVSDYVRRCVPIGVETVLSTTKYKPLVESVLAAGGFFGLIYVALKSPDIALTRIQQRIREGGHSVPEDKLRSRWTRSLANFPWFASQASQFFVFDNSDPTLATAPELVAYGCFGVVKWRESCDIPQLEQSLAMLSPQSPR